MFLWVTLSKSTCFHLKSQRPELDSYLSHMHSIPDRRLGQNYKENTDFDGGVIRKVQFVA